MTEESFNPEKTLVILLGASAWHPDRKTFAHSYPTEDNPFQRSVDGMRDYFLSSLQVPTENIKDLFNSQDNADAILEQIEEFLKKSGINKTDLFIYYVGHGTIATGEFCFAIRWAKNEKYDLSAKKLWLALGENAFNLRNYLILDACFSGNMTGLRVSAPGGPRSTLFFCSALNEPLKIGQNEKGENITVFTEALLKTLHGENPYLPVFPSQLSFNKLEAPLKQFLQKFYPQTLEPHFDPVAITLKNLKIFENKRLAKIREEFSEHQEAILPITKSVHNYLRNVENKELTESDKSQLDQLAKFLTGETSAEEFIHFWQTHSVSLELNYQELSEKLQQGSIVVFLGANVPKQDGQLLNELKELVEYSSFEGHLSELCEYTEMTKGRTFLCDKVAHEMPKSANPVNMYELLATIQEPLTIISTEYTTLLEETFEKHHKLFVTLSTINKGKFLLKRSDSTSDIEEITEEELSGDRGKNLQKYTLIYKIRGCFGLDKQHLILSERDYFNFARSLETSVPAYLINLIRTLGLLFIDYHPKNWEDRLIAQTILPPILSQLNADVIAIHGEADGPFIKAYWKNKEVMSYSVKISEFVEKLTAHLAVSEDSDVP